MEQNLTNEQLNELFASDPRAEMEISAEEMDAWFMASQVEDLDSLNPYNDL